MALCTITETFLNSEGDPVPGVVVKFTTPVPQATEAGELLVEHTVSVTSDASGNISVDLLQGVTVLVTCRRLGLEDSPIFVPDLADADLGSLLNSGDDEAQSLGIPTFQQVMLRSDSLDGNTDMYVDAGGYALYNMLAVEVTGVPAPYFWAQGLGTDATYYASSGLGGGDGIFEADADGNQGHQFRSDRANNRGKIHSGGNPFLIHQVNSQTAIMQGAAVMAESTGDMVDGFGSGLAFRIMDTAQVENTIGLVGAVRDGADNSGYLTFQTANAGVLTEQMTLTKAGVLETYGGILASSSVSTTPTLSVENTSAQYPSVFYSHGSTPDTTDWLGSTAFVYSDIATGGDTWVSLAVFAATSTDDMIGVWSEAERGQAIHGHSQGGTYPAGVVGSLKNGTSIGAGVAGIRNNGLTTTLLATIAGGSGVFGASALKAGVFGYSVDVAVPGVLGVASSGDAGGGEFYGHGTGAGVYGEAATGAAAFAVQGYADGSAPTGYFENDGSGAALVGDASGGTGHGVVAKADTTTPVAAALLVIPQDDFPSSPQLGAVFYHSGNAKHYGYNGSWNALY